MSRQCWAELAPLGRNRVGNETHVLFPVTPSPVSLLMIFVKEKEKKGPLLTSTNNPDRCFPKQQSCADGGGCWLPLHWDGAASQCVCPALAEDGALVGRRWLRGVTQ